MTRLAQFLSQRLSERGTSASFARRLNVSQATVTRWVTGKSEPDFESCVRIADYFDLDPREVFSLAGKPDFEALYNRIFPEFKRAHVSEGDLYKNDDHARLHSRIQRLLDRGRTDKVEAHVRLLEEEQALIESEQLFKWVFEYGPLGMTMTAPDYRFVRVNKMFSRMVGYSQEELTGMKFTDITHPEDLESSLQTVQKLFSGEISYHKTEKRYIRKDGSTLWVSLTGCLITDEAGWPLYSIGMFEDISERKITEERLRASEGKYRLLFEKHKYPTYITSEDGKVVDVNDAALESRGVSRQEVIGRDSTSILSHPACISILIKAVGWQAGEPVGKQAASDEKAEATKGRQSLKSERRNAGARAGRTQQRTASKR